MDRISGAVERVAKLKPKRKKGKKLPPSCPRCCGKIEHKWLPSQGREVEVVFCVERDCNFSGYTTGKVRNA